MHKKRINDVEEGVLAVAAVGRLMRETQKRDADFSASLFCVCLSNTYSAGNWVPS